MSGKQPQARTSQCPMRQVLDMIGGKWKLAILWELHSRGVLRFTELQRAVTGITNTMLAHSLQELQEDGLVERTQYNEMPLKVEYTLSEAGQKLVPILCGLADWGAGHLGITP